MSENLNGQQVYGQQPYGQSVYVYGQQAQGQPVYGQPFPAPRPQTKQTENMKKHFGILGPACILYSCFYALCMYRNSSGITYPFFLAGSFWFYCFCFKKLEISLKKDSIFYMISILLLGLSTFCTADGRVIAMNKAGVWVLTISFLLHQVYKDENWTFGRYVGYVIAAVFGSLGQIARPFQDLTGHRRERGKKGSGIAIYIIIGITLGIPLFCVIWLLLMSADTIFYDITYGIAEKLFMGTVLEDGFGVLFTVIFMFFMAYCIMAYLCKKTFSEEYRERKQTEAVLAITVLAPIMILYLVFCGIQIVFLFLGKMILEGYTYAEYARQGFFQLLIVCIINLVLVLVGHAYFKENKALKGMLTVVSLCTYIMIASSAYRMILYVQHYYLTFLRIFVLWSLLVLFILLTGVIVSIYKKSFPLFKYSMVVVTVCYLALSFSHPDYWIAKCNLANLGNMENSSGGFFRSESYNDYRYLAGLSADAAPALAEFLKEEGFSLAEVEAKVENGTNSSGHISYYEIFGGPRSSEECWGSYYLAALSEDYKDMGIRGFNLSKFIGYQLVK
ncbi:MAG: DUF4173 domain-containing protein [Lachnospiraceae bacterium]|nr:DUF4173 domain-containing protein [Lachnospiraceae bacterium]